MYAFLIAIFTNQKLLGVSHNNKPLEEAAKTLHAWTATPELEKLSCLANLWRRVVAFKLLTTAPKTDTHEPTREEWEQVRVLIATTSVFADRYGRPHSKFVVFAAQVHILTFDEAQQFGAATDAWLLAILPIFALLVFLGDQVQPLGAGSTELQRALRQLLGSYRPALRAVHVKPVMPAQYLQKVCLFDQGGNTVKQLSSCKELFADMAAGYKLPPPNSIAEILGYSEPGALLLPVSVRAPHTIYQTVGLIAYSEQLVVPSYCKVHSRVEEAAATSSINTAISSTSSSYSSDSEG
jgi:hypothetical protein